MGTYKKYSIIAVLAFSLLLSACGINGSGSSTSVGQLLQNSLNAMKQLNAVHVDMTFSGGVNTGSSTSTAKPITLKLTGDGDTVKPDKASIHLSMGQGFNLSEITIGKQVYVQSAKGQWYVLDTSKMSSSAVNPFSSMNASSYNNLLALAQKATISDHGDQNLNGQSLRHITITFGQNALRDLLNATGETSKLTPAQQQSLNKALSNIKLSNASLDVWIDEATNYVHQMELKFNMSVNTSSMMTPTTSTSSIPSNISTSIDTTIDYSKFNESITISAPANAIPTSNPGVIFGRMSGMTQ